MKRKLTYSTKSRAKLLDLIIRHGLVTSEAAHARVCPHAKINAARKILARLQQLDLIEGHYLDNRTCYYTLPDGRLGTQAFFERAAILYFCVLYSTTRQRLTQAEVQLQLPWVQKSSAGVWCTEDNGGSTRFLAVRIDHGGPPASVIEKVKQFKADCGTYKEFQQLLVAGCFQLVFLTPTKMRSERLAKEVNCCPELKGFPFRAQSLVQLAKFHGLSHM